MSALLDRLLELPSGTELDGLVEDIVFEMGRTANPTEAWSVDGNSMMKVIAWMRCHPPLSFIGGRPTVSFGVTEDEAGWYACWELDNGEGSDISHLCHADTLPVAVCRAALCRALKMKEEKGGKSNV